LVGNRPSGWMDGLQLQSLLVSFPFTCAGIWAPAYLPSYLLPSTPQNDQLPQPICIKIVHLLIPTYLIPGISIFYNMLHTHTRMLFSGFQRLDISIYLQVTMKQVSSHHRHGKVSCIIHKVHTYLPYPSFQHCFVTASI